MPNRAISIAIVLFWLVATSVQLRRDVMPRLITGDAPNLSGLARSEALPPPTTWKIKIPDLKAVEAAHEIGIMMTRANRGDNGQVVLTSEVKLEANRLIGSTAFENNNLVSLSIDAETVIDRDGSFLSFNAKVFEDLSRSLLITMDGARKDNQVEIRAQGLDGKIQITKSFPFKTGASIQNSLNPLDRMTNLQVGQLWKSQVINPLSGQVVEARVEVKSRQVIRWGNSLIETLQVDSHMSPFTARAWVRPEDGLVVRQEIPLALVTLILDRVEDAKSISPSPR